MQSQTGVQLPVAYNQVDASCFNQSLPQGNDKWPQVTFLPGSDQQLAGYAIALFRTYAQSRAQKSPIHCFCYNLLQMNQFSNQFWQQWCQYVVDFCDFLVRGQQQPQQQAADKAAARIYQCMLATTINQYPAIRQFLDQATQAGLNDAAQLAGTITNDINQWKMRVMQGGQQGMGQPGGMVGMTGGGVGMPGGGMSQGGGMIGMAGANNVNSFAVSGVGQTATPYSNPQGPSSTGGNGMLLGVTKPPSQPTSTWAPTAAQPQHGVQGMAAITPTQPGAMTMQKAQASDIIDHQHNAPVNVEDIVVDPKHYVPKGLVIDSNRPFDHIRNPGGVEIRPAHLVKWKRTVGGDVPYAKLYNPLTHMRFMAKWVDGIVKEVIVPITPEMDYLKHEVNEELRRKAMRPKGIVVPLPQYSVSENLSVKTMEQTKEALETGEVLAAHLNPVEVDGYITGTTDLENETMARNQVIGILGLDPKDPLPPHEYITVQMHELDITEKCFNELQKFEHYTKPQEVVDALKVLVESGDLPLRYFTFINKRLTTAVNEFLRDSLSLDKIQIDDYFEDAVELGPYLTKKRGNEYEAVYLGNTQSIVGRSLSVASESMEETPEGEAPVENYGIIDEHLNFQLGIPSDELSNLNLSEEACLVSPISHPNLVAALRAMTERARVMNTMQRVRMRLITSDGFYYGAIVGKLVKGALLLKKL